MVVLLFLVYCCVFCVNEGVDEFCEIVIGVEFVWVVLVIGFSCGGLCWFNYCYLEIGFVEGGLVFWLY